MQAALFLGGLNINKMLGRGAADHVSCDALLGDKEMRCEGRGGSNSFTESLIPLYKIAISLFRILLFMILILSITVSLFTVLLYEILILYIGSFYLQFLIRSFHFGFPYMRYFLFYDPFLVGSDPFLYHPFMYDYPM